MRLPKEKYIIVLCLLILWGLELYGQKHQFSVHKGGKEIGEITASLTKSPYAHTYEILSDVTFKILWKQYRRKTNNLVVYQDESMKTSASGVYMNDDLEDSASVNQDRNHYQVFRYPDERYLLKDTELRFTTAKLYFQEPVGIHQVYSERFLQYCPLKSDGDHRYKLYLPDNKVNYYTYADRELVKVFIDRTWFNLEFRKK